jgi:hypothetical protein
VSRHHSRVLDVLQSFFVAATRREAFTHRVQVTQGYRDLRILRVRLVDYFILVRIISRDLVGRLSSISRAEVGSARKCLKKEMMF